MPNRIMVPLNGSAFAEQALPRAVGIARRSGAQVEVVLVRALLPLESAGAEAEEYVDRVASRLERDLPGRVERRVLTDDVGPLAYPLPLDAVAEVLARHAVENDVDLIVMATHGRGGLRRAWLGSVGDALMRIAPRPILLVHPGDGPIGIADGGRHHVFNIIIPLDGSTLAEQAIPHAVELGNVFNARYTLVRVIIPLSFRIGSDWNGTFLTTPVQPMDRTVAEGYLMGVAAQMRAQGLDVTTYVAEGASPGGAIIEYAKTYGGDLIALSTAGAGGIRRMLLGSVADRISRDGGVPTLVCNVRAIADSMPLLAAAAEPL